MRKALFTVLAVLFLVLAVSCSSEIGKNTTVYIVGVGLDYQNISDTKARSLKGTINDTVELVECLSEIYAGKGSTVEAVYMLQEGESPDTSASTYPTADNVISMLEGLEPSKDDFVVFLYSGHGTNIDHGIFATAAEAGSDIYTKLEMKDVFDILDSYLCPSLAIIDCCYSGIMSQENSFESNTLKDAVSSLFAKYDYKAACVIAASTAYEESFEDSSVNPGHPHGYLAKSVLEVLGWSHDGSTKVTINGKARTLNGYLKKIPSRMGVSEFFTRVYGTGSFPYNSDGTRQTPTMNGTVLDITVVP